MDTPQVKGDADVMNKAMMLLGTLVVLLALAPPATAEDGDPCGDPYWREMRRAGVEEGIWVQDCSLWRGDVPVYASPFNMSHWEDEGDVVGHLWNAEGNWFLCQEDVGDVYWGPGDKDYANTWWAYTMADNGAWGWVSEVYFSGGDDYEGDANLANCPDDISQQSKITIGP